MLLATQNDRDGLTRESWRDAPKGRDGHTGGALDHHPVLHDHEPNGVRDLGFAYENAFVDQRPARDRA